MQKFLKIFFIGLIFSFARAQNDPLAKNLFINPDLQLSIDYWHIKHPDYKFHSAFKPYLSGSISKMADSSVPFKHYMIHNFFLSKIFNDAPEKVNQWILQVHPIVDAVAGYDMLDKKVCHQVLGGTNIKVGGNNDFVFSGTVYGGNVSLPFYMDSMYKSGKVIPGFGQVYGDNTKGYQVFDYNGYVSYSPQNNKIFNFQLGRDRHFIGDGYRSVLLSDYANPYPYFRINTNIWHFQYNVWYTLMNDVSGANGVKSKYQNKYGAFHYLSWNVLKELNIGIFENVIWRGKDTSEVRSFDVNYLNPFIFYRPVEYSVGSPDNSFLGLNINTRIAHTLKLYGQLGLDEFFLKEIRARKGWWGNKQGWQLGLNYINAAGIKGLNVQLEYNQVRPYTYSHGIVAQNYGHYALPLAHPYGANFKEYLTIVNYRKNRFQISAKGIYAEIGKDSLGTNSNMGQNIYKSYVTRPYEYGHKTTQGDKNIILQSDIRFTYWIIPNINARVEVGYIQRSESSAAGYKLENPYIYVGFRTSFWNMYND
jgi:hypothetical protein